MRLVALIVAVTVAVSVGAVALLASGKEPNKSVELPPLDLNAAPSAALKTKNAALIRDPEEKYSYPETRKSKRGHKKAGIPEASSTKRVAPGAPSDAELRGELRRERKSGAANGDGVELLADGTAQAPFDAPPEVNAVVGAANTIARFPYIWGGGHDTFSDVGYDCSGSLSYALSAAGLVDEPIDSGQFMKWGARGPGKWITVYANAGHTFMIVGGLRYDTSFRDGPRGSRWQDAPRPMNGFEVRHWPGL